MLEALYVATANAAPATTAATSAYDWKWLVPVATLIIGFVLKWLQDHFTEQSRRKHDQALRRDQRRDALRIQKHDAERENLLALQPLVVELLAAGRALRSFRRSILRQLPGGPSDEEKLREAIRQLASKVLPIRARLHSVEANQALDELVTRLWESVNSASEDSAEIMGLWQAVEDTHAPAQSAIGRAIKALDDEPELARDAG